MHPEPTLQNVSEEEQSGGEDANEDIVSITRNFFLEISKFTT